MGRHVPHTGRRRSASRHPFDTRTPAVVTRVAQPRALALDLGAATAARHHGAARHVRAADLDDAPARASTAPPCCTVPVGVDLVEHEQSTERAPGEVAETAAHRERLRRIARARSRATPLLTRNTYARCR